MISKIHYENSVNDTILLENSNNKIIYIYESSYEKNIGFAVFLISRKTVFLAHFYYNSLCSILEVNDISEFTLN